MKGADGLAQREHGAETEIETAEADESFGGYETDGPN